MRLTQSLTQAASLHGERAGTLCGDRRRTWREILDRVSRLAAGLRAFGVQPGDRVGILALNADYYLEAYYAIAWSGGIAVPGNTRWALAEHAAAFKECEIKCLLVDDDHLKLAQDLSFLDRRGIILLGATDGPPEFARTESWIADYPPADDAGGADQDVAAIFYTGGTTGRAKGVMLTHRSLLVNFLQSTVAAPFPDDAVYLHAAPMFHMADAGLIFGLSFSGATHVMVPKFEPGLVVETIARHEVNCLLLVPTMIGMLADHLKMKEGSLPSVKMLRYGASPISESLCSEAMAIFSGAEISQAYGQTELSPTVTLLNHRDHRTGGKLLRSAGRPIPGVEIKIRDGAGRELSSGEVGEVHVRSDGIMAGYWLQPALTEATIVEGWLRTGDAGYCDENGYLFLVDRVKDMIVSGGENVYSAEVENAIELHPEVRQCAVIGLPDDKWGERVHAVVRRVGGSELTAASLVDHCRAHIAGYKCPRTIEFWEEPLPTSGAGKILKTELRKIVTTRDVNSA